VTTRARAFLQRLRRIGCFWQRTVRERFIKRVAGQVAPLVQALLRREIAEGRLRADLDPVLGALSLAGMLLMPFLAAPVVRRALDVRLEDDAFRLRFVAHTARLFFEGAGVPGARA